MDDKIPFFSAPDQPELETALNRLVTQVNIASNFKLRGSERIGVDISDGLHTVKLLDQPELDFSVRFRCELVQEEGRIFVGKGHVAFMPEDKGLIQPVRPTMAGTNKRIAEPMDATGEVPSLELPLAGAGQEQWVLVRCSAEAAVVFLHDTSQELPPIKKGEFIFQVAEAIVEAEGELFSWKVNQVWDSDIIVPLVESPSSSDSSGDSSSDSSSGSSSISSDGSSDVGSDKSTAIVKASWNNAYTALFIAEMPEVRFDDVVIILVPRDAPRRFTASIDPKFVEVCHFNTIEAVGYTTEKSVAVGLVVFNECIEVEMPLFNRPRRIVVRLSAIRKGFDGHRFPDRTRKQFEDNERFINSAYQS